MARTTKSELRERVNRLRNYTGLRLFIQWAYGRPRVYQEAGDGASEISPRLPMGQMDEWLSGFETAVNLLARKEGGSPL